MYWLGPPCCWNSRDPEALEAGVTHRLAEFARIDAEPARTAGACGQEDVTVEDLLRRQPLFIAKLLKALHKVAHRKIGGIALAPIAEFLPEAESLLRRNFKRFGLVSQTAETRRDDQIMRAAQTAKQDRRGLPLGPLERALRRPRVMDNRLLA